MTRPSQLELCHGPSYDTLKAVSYVNICLYASVSESLTQKPVEARGEASLQPFRRCNSSTFIILLQNSRKIILYEQIWNSNRFSFNPTARRLFHHLQSALLQANTEDFVCTRRSLVIKCAERQWPGTRRNRQRQQLKQTRHLTTKSQLRPPSGSASQDSVAETHSFRL